MEDLEDTTYFDENALPDVSLLDSGVNYSNNEGNKLFVEGSGK